MVGARATGDRAAGAHALDRRPLDVLVILDGASEPLGDGPTSLERADTPVLDSLAAAGTVTLLRTVPPGLPAGSETAIPALLGWAPDRPVDRGAIEAAAHGIELGGDERAWRVDRVDRVDAAGTALALAERLPGHRVRHLAGHRMLVVGPEPLPALGVELRAWPGGAIPPRVLNVCTVVVGARGAAVGIARLMGAQTIVPRGATGRPGSDLAAKADAALTAIHAGARRVVVHVGAPDEAAHERDADGKVAAIEAADAQLLAPLADALRARRGKPGPVADTLRVCPDHGCDPATGEHDSAPVPCLCWPAPSMPDVHRLAGRAPYATGGARLTERAVAGQPVIALASITSAGSRWPSGRAVAA